MRITKSIFLSFGGDSIATASISVPFKVSRIHVKGIGYVPQNAPAAGAAIYGVITSDLVDNQPLGLFYNDVTYSYATNKDMELTLYTPKTIGGSYTFYLQNELGNPYSPTPSGGNPGNDDCVLILEFNSDVETD
jgi:hypothetical protein